MKIVPLRHALSVAPLLTYETEQIILQTLSLGKRVICYLNRRGALRVLSCKDCGAPAKCPICGIGLVAHIQPRISYQCHHCNYITEHLESCEVCHGESFEGIGFGLQSVELGFRKIFPQKKILRFDGDSERKKASFQKELDTADIIIATDIGSSYWDESIGLKIILNSSAELTHPHFSTEERLYRLLHLHENENSETIVQTTQPEGETIQILCFGNYKEFLQWSLKQRRQFGYPPYNEYALLVIKKKSSEEALQAQEIMYQKLLQTDLTVWKPPTVSHRGLGEYQSTLILLGKSIRNSLGESFAREIARSRYMELQYES